jgi:uncharacterized membrane protein YozB (DUF420 family)
MPVTPFKAYTPLFVNADGILPFPVPARRMKSVSRIQHERFQTRSGMQNHETLPCLSFKRLKTADAEVVKQLFGITAGKRFNHMRCMLQKAQYVKLLFKKEAVYNVFLKESKVQKTRGLDRGCFLFLLDSHNIFLYYSGLILVFLGIKIAFLKKTAVL